MDKCFTEVVQAADGPWPVLAIFLIGLYVLVWRFGSQLLSVAKDAHTETKNISESIITNHGSKNIGDAVDRLTESVWAIQGYVEGIDVRLTNLEEKE